MMVRRLDRETLNRSSEKGYDPAQRMSVVRGQRGGNDDAKLEPLTSLFQLDPLTLVLLVIDVADLYASAKDLPVVPGTVILTGDLESAGDDQLDSDRTCYPGFIHDDLDLTVEHGILLRLADLVDDTFPQNLQLGLGRMNEHNRLGDMQLEMTLM